MQYNKSSLLAILAAAPSITAFAPSHVKNAQLSLTSSLKATVDPETITKKEYEDICGVNFDQELLQKRLERTAYLYPKHVEVVEDLAPIVDEMVDNIVSFPYRLLFVSTSLIACHDWCQECKVSFSLVYYYLLFG
jgi:hypothetical protein